MEYIRYYSTIILWASPFALSRIIRNYDGEFPSKIARTLFHPNNISYVGRMIIRPSNESGRSRPIDIYVRCFPDSRPRRTHFHATPVLITFLERSGTSEFTYAPLLNTGLKVRYLRTSYTQKFEFSQGVRTHLTHLVWERHCDDAITRTIYLRHRARRPT